jgi:type III pantothenate kinase
MLLAVDVGNTNITLGLYDGATLRDAWRMQTDPARTPDEYELLLRGFLASRGYRPEQVTRTVMASVVPVLSEALRGLLARAFGRLPLIVGPGIKTGITVRYSPPSDVGADRIVNAVAAFARHRTACVVVDFGTATTFDCISGRGEYVGGAIAPGVGLSMGALFQRTAKLPKVDVARPVRVVGRSTVESIQSGAFYGYVGLVDGLVRRILDEMGEDEVRVIATGGLAPTIAADSCTIREVDEHLTLEGLRILAEANSDRIDAPQPGSADDPLPTKSDGD